MVLVTYKVAEEQVPKFSPLGLVQVLGELSFPKYRHTLLPNSSVVLTVL